MLHCAQKPQNECKLNCEKVLGDHDYVFVIQ